MAIIVQDLLLQPRGFTAFTVRKGQTLRIIDIEGQQVGDVVVFNHSDHADKLSPQNTIVLNRTANLRTGNSLFSTRANKMLKTIWLMLTRREPYESRNEKRYQKKLNSITA